MENVVDCAILYYNRMFLQNVAAMRGKTEWKIQMGII